MPWRCRPADTMTQATTGLPERVSQRRPGCSRPAGLVSRTVALTVVPLPEHRGRDLKFLRDDGLGRPVAAVHHRRDVHHRNPAHPATWLPDRARAEARHAPTLGQPSPSHTTIARAAAA